ncbi:hypothetical protein [Legionella shakespearei]|uniref:Uncharacterized protein n=1 Tax=Legionella shakespearei DSM 23087 TaxID=1122169 RepID=A0A0W0YQH2_9GAMM|nr:hypothetical protein [Legionella shakespearei]KTD59117.1 hypothetical protein Lsha_1997 [Legionella shakespearei DSM 23087]
MLPFAFASYSQTLQSLNQKPVYNRESSMLFHEELASSQTTVSDSRANTTNHDKTPAKKASASRERATLQPIKSERETKRTSEEKRDSFFSLKIGKFSFATGHDKEKRANKSSFRH